MPPTNQELSPPETSKPTYLRAQILATTKTPPESSIFPFKISIVFGKDATASTS
jgi:hypothetical protein